MKNKKLAVLLGTFFLISSLILPSIAAADDQVGTVVVSGMPADIFYNGYSGTIPGVTFTAVTSSAFDQDTLANYNAAAAGAQAWKDASIGIIDISGDDVARSLTVQGPAALTNVAGDSMDLGDGRNANRLEVETTVNKVSGGTIILADSDAVNYTFTQDLSGATDDLDALYWIPSGATYTWSNADVTYPLNNAAALDFTRADAYNSGIIAAPVEVLSKEASTGFMGAAVTQFSFSLDVPTTPPGTYTGNITYTLT